MIGRIDLNGRHCATVHATLLARIHCIRASRHARDGRFSAPRVYRVAESASAVTFWGKEVLNLSVELESCD